MWVELFPLEIPRPTQIPQLWRRQNTDVTKGLHGPIAWTEACLLLGSSNVLEHLLCPDGSPCCKPVSLTLGMSDLNPNWYWPIRPLATATIISPRGHALPQHLAGNYFISWNTMTTGLRKERRAYTMGSGTNRKLNARSETNPISSNTDLWKDSIQRL